jgi:hypothetical protein
MHETIPSQILDSFSELFDLGHTFSAHGSNARIVVWGVRLSPASP